MMSNYALIVNTGFFKKELTIKLTPQKRSI